MNAKANTWRLGAVTRNLILLPALVVAVSLALTGAASAQTAFQASIKGINTKPGPPCAPTITTPVTGVLCGSTTIAGYGPAVWTLNANITGALSSACFTYTGTTTFQLLSGDGTLFLDETGTACAPGNSGSAPRHDWFGPPLFATASWTVDPASTGVFAGLASSQSAGTDTAQLAGAHTSATYTGTLS
jgi:hypothetical protein